MDQPQSTKPGGFASQQDFDDFTAVVKERFDAVDARFDAVDARFEAVDARFDAVDARFDATDKTLNRILRGLKAVMETVQSTDKRMKDMGSHGRRIERLENAVFLPGKSKRLSA